MKNIQTNRRTKMTRRLLKDSLIELMKTKAIRNITIKEICDKADVNRSTFYRHYDTQYDLYNDIFEDVTGDIINIVKNVDLSEVKTQSLLTRMLQYAEDNRELILIILSDNGSLSIGQAFSELIGRVLGEKRGNNSPPSELEMYVIQFISAGMANIVWIWLNTDDRRSAREVAGVVNTLVMNGLQRAISFASSR